MAHLSVKESQKVKPAPTSQALTSVFARVWGVRSQDPVRSLDVGSRQLCETKEASGRVMRGIAGASP